MVYLCVPLTTLCLPLPFCLPLSTLCLCKVDSLRLPPATSANLVHRPRPTVGQAPTGRRLYIDVGYDPRSVYPWSTSVYWGAERTTVIRFVEHEYSHPIDRLESVLALNPQSTAPLDDLYTQILSSLPQKPQQLRILHAIWRTTLPRGLDRLDPEKIDMLLNLRPSTCRLTLRGLHSLFSVPPLGNQFSWAVKVTFLHASFTDYLRDDRRSVGWCVWMPWLEEDYFHSLHSEPW
ncbi:hypothetical protein K438DRAFT_1783958 [Mycena galopus ATCC 62051]|nr:hypothetical protein K438DRAFT_1783958 [Mycena galopus ATCC 62051]